eukprot:XP_020408465.1 uncharacterized protein LOC103654725 isoform X1 [Zea mays]
MQLQVHCCKILLTEFTGKPTIPEHLSFLKLHVHHTPRRRCLDQDGVDLMEDVHLSPKNTHAQALLDLRSSEAKLFIKMALFRLVVWHVMMASNHQCYRWPPQARGLLQLLDRDRSEAFLAMESFVGSSISFIGGHVIRVDLVLLRPCLQARYY